MSKNKILVLGSGLVSRPGVHYLLDRPNLSVTVASNELPVAEALVSSYKNGKAVFIDVKDEARLGELVRDHDIIVSLLPWTFHVQVARLCLQYGKDMATASYVSEGMRSLDQEARAKGLLFMNELGVDPGIDHMSTMKIINEVTEEGGKIVHFYSFCGGLPAPESNDNPFGYKFSWSPRGVILASRNSAQFLENGEIVRIDGKDLFSNYRIEEIEGLGQFEVYPNRDSVPYKEFYGLKDAQTVMRGTYRYPGWCDTLKTIVDLGLVDDTPRQELQSGTFKTMMSGLVGASNEDDLPARTAEKLGMEKESQVMKRLEWLGLFADEPLPTADNYLDILSSRMQSHLNYKPGERDLLLMRHKFIVQNKNGAMEEITSTMIDYGQPEGDTSMARTVSLPLAIAVRMMAEEGIPLAGVQIPTVKPIYEPILKELAALNIKLEEKRTPLS